MQFPDYDSIHDEMHVRITDLPLEAQVKLFERKHFRDNLQSHALNLYTGQPAEGAEGGADPMQSDLVPLDWQDGDSLR